MKFLSICSGIEAASVAFKPLGWKAVGFSEIEPFPCAVLQHHYPNIPNLGDMTKFKDWRIDGTVDIVCGGTPCQAFSIAGKRESLNDERGNLSLIFCKICDHFDPEIVIWENVPGVLNTKDNAFGCFLAELAGLDEPVKPRSHPTRHGKAGIVNGRKRLVAWRTLDAQYFGVPQRRRRVFVVAFRGSGNWRAAATLFPISERVQGVVTARRSTRKNITTFAQNGFADHSQPTLASGKDVTGTILANCGTKQWLGNQEGFTGDFHVVHGFQDPCVNNDLAHPVSRNNGLENVIAIAGNTIGRQEQNGGNGNGFDDSGVSYTLTSTDIHGVVFWNGDVTPKFNMNVANTLRANQGGEGNGVAYASLSEPSNAVKTVASIAPTLTQGFGARGQDYNQLIDGGAIIQKPLNHAKAHIRRLTPMECERLQGFPDNYTKIPYKGKPAEECPDGPRYKALGNSWAVPVVQWLGKRIEKMMEIKDEAI